MLLGLSNKQAVILVDNATKREYFVRPKRIKASQLWFASLDRTILACRHLALYGTRLLCPMASYSQNIVTKNMATCTCLSSFCMVLGPRPRWSCVAHLYFYRVTELIPFPGTLSKNQVLQCATQPQTDRCTAAGLKINNMNQTK